MQIFVFGLQIAPKLAAAKLEIAARIDRICKAVLDADALHQPAAKTAASKHEKRGVRDELLLLWQRKGRAEVDVGLLRLLLLDLYFFRIARREKR